MIKLMPRKKKNKSAAIAKTQKGKSSRTRTKRSGKPSAKKTFAKKQKTEPEVLPVLNDEKLKELYATMVRCRVLTQQMHGKLTGNSSNSVFGFEATLVGAGAHLLAKDCIAMEHSSFVASLIKGTPLIHNSCAQQRTPKRRTGSNCFSALWQLRDGSQHGNCFGVGCADEK